MQIELGGHFRLAAAKFDRRIAVQSAERSLTYHQLRQATNRIGSAIMRLGVERGDRVARWSEGADVLEVELRGHGRRRRMHLRNDGPLLAGVAHAILVEIGLVGLEERVLELADREVGQRADDHLVAAQLRVQQAAQTVGFW